MRRHTLVAALAGAAAVTGCAGRQAPDTGPRLQAAPRILSVAREHLDLQIIQPASIWVFRMAPNRTVTLLYPAEEPATVLQPGRHLFEFDKQPDDLRGVPIRPPASAQLVARNRPCTTPRIRERRDSHGGRYQETYYECSSSVGSLGSIPAFQSPERRPFLILLAAPEPPPAERVRDVLTAYRPAGDAQRVAFDLGKALFGEPGGDRWRRQVVPLR